MLKTTDLLRVLEQYDLGILYTSTTICQGNVNESAIVETSEGRFVVRRNHRSHSDRRHHYRHHLEAHLWEQNFPVAAPLLTRSGTTLLHLDGRSYEVVPFVRGNEYNPRQPQQQTSVGNTLARYHTLVQGFPAPPDNPELRYNPRQLLSLVEILIQRDVMGDLSDMLEWYNTRAATLRRLLPDEQYKALPHLVIHGDVHADNFLFDQDEVVALLDYDQIAWDTPVADLADALVAFATVDRPKVAGWGVYPGPLDEARAEHVLAAYGEVRPLAQREVAALPVLLEVIWLQGELARVVNTPEGAPDYHLAVLEQGCQLSRWLGQRHDQLTTRWEQITAQFSFPAPAAA